MRSSTISLAKTPARDTRAMAFALVVLILTASLLSGCRLPNRSEPDSRKSVVVFIDKTGSTDNDRRIFAQALERIIKGLQPGDCVRVSLITESSSRDYVDVVECQVPDALEPQNMLLENTLVYRKRQRVHAQADSLILAELRADVARLLGLPSDRHSTAIFETLKIASQIFAGETRPRQFLVLLSDMVETNAKNFNRIHIDNNFIEHLIGQHEEAHMLPDLAGVAVYAVGVGGQSIEHSARLEQFWSRYLTAAGAFIPPGAFGRALPVFGI